MLIVDSLLNEDKSSNVNKTIALSLASFLNTCMNVILLMLIARCLEKQEVSVYMQSMMVYNTLFPFLQLGITNGLYYVLVNDEKHAHKLIMNGIAITFISTGSVSLFFMLGGNCVLADYLHNDQIINALLWIVPYMIVGAAESVIIVGYIYYNRIRFVAYYNVIKSIICVCVLILTTQVTGKGEWLIASRAIMSCVCGFTIIFALYKYVIKSFNISVDRKSIYIILKVSLPLGIASMAGNMSGKLDQWIISTMLSPEIYAIYQMGAYELPVISMITGAISTVVIVEINKAVKNGEVDKAIWLFSRIAEKTSLILMPCMVFFLCASRDLICFLFTERYVDSVPVFCVYLLYIPIRCVIYGPMFIALGKSKNVMYREFISLVLNLFLSVIMVRCLGMIGAALATIVTSYCFGVVYNIYSLSKWTFTPWWKILPFKRMIEFIVISLPGGMITLLLSNEMNNDLYLVNVIVECVVFTVITMYLYKVLLHITPLMIIKAVRK